MKIVSAVCSTTTHLWPTCSLLLITVGCTQWLLGTKDGCAVVGHTVAHFLFRFFSLVFFLISSRTFFSYIYFLNSVTYTQFCLTVKPSKPKIGLEHNIFIYIYIYLTVQSKPIRTPVENQQGLQKHTHTHTRPHTLHCSKWRCTLVGTSSFYLQ